MPLNRLEYHFNKFVTSFGGELVVDLMPRRRNPPPNADYLFRGANVIGELKCLENLTFTEQYSEQLSKMTWNWIDRGLIPRPATSKFTISLKHIPEGCQREWLRLLMKPLQKNLVLAANTQIKSTKRFLNLPSASGLLLVASDGNNCLQPSDVIKLLARILNKPDFSSIDHIVYFTPATRPVSVPGIRCPAAVWASAHRSNSKRTIPDQFIDELQHGWMCYEAAHGDGIWQEIIVTNPADSFLDQIKFLE